LVPALTLSQVPMALAQTSSQDMSGQATAFTSKKASHKAHKPKSGTKTKKKSRGSATKIIRTFAGTISELMPNGFTVNLGKKGSYQVEITTDSRILGKKNAAMTFADVKVGDRVRVKGKLDLVDKSIGAIVSIKDLGLSKKKAQTGSSTDGTQGQSGQTQSVQNQGTTDAGAFLLL